MSAIPSHLSISDFAMAIGMPRRQVARMVAQGQLPSDQMTERGKHRIPLQSIREQYPSFWAALVDRWDELSERLDDNRIEF